MEREIEEEEKELLAEGEVSLVIDNYDEIFSSFDPRPYSRRALSVDFLDEARRATREIKPGVFELRFLLPFSERKLEREGMIKKRLKEHFRKHAEIIEKEKSRIVKQGIYFVALGLVFMLVAAFVLYHYHNVMSLMKEMLVVMLEPGGWFLFWEGMDLIIFKSQVVKPDLEFYKKMTRAEIIFSHH